MSDLSNRPTRNITTGVRSIQERIRAMNETLDSVEQCQKQEPIMTVSKQNMVDHHSTTKDFDHETSLLLPPIMKRSSVVDIWRMRESRNGGGVGVAAVDGLVAKTTLTSNEETARSTDCVSQDVEIKNPISKRVIPLRSHVHLEQSEEKKEDEQCDVGVETTPISLPGKWRPIRTVASASPSPPLLPGSKRKSYVFVC
jgi:hypothetical protein